MGGIASTCVRDCVRTSHEYAGEEDVLHASSLTSLAQSGASSGSRTTAGGAAASVVVPNLGNISGANGSSGAGLSGAVPPVPNWFEALQNGRQARAASAETPRFDEVVQTSPRLDSQASPRGSVAGEYTHRTQPSPRDSPPPSARPPEEGKADELSYEGTYLGAMKHGSGTLRMHNATYQGEFNYDMKHGIGTLTWDDGRQYRGGFVINKFHGQAVMTWPDGRKYVGLYADDRKHGEGTFSWQDGRRYQGQWVCGKRHGVGIYTNAKGFTRKGHWQTDRPLSWDAPGVGDTITPVTDIEVTVCQAIEEMRAQHVPLSSPRKAEEIELDLEVKVSNI